MSVLLSDNWLITLKPCPRADCEDGWSYVENDWCSVCKGQGGLPVEVHEACNGTEDECRCFDEVGARAA